MTRESSNQQSPDDRPAPSIRILAVLAVAVSLCVAGAGGCAATSSTNTAKSMPVREKVDAADAPPSTSPVDPEEPAVDSSGAPIVAPDGRQLTRGEVIASGGTLPVAPPQSPTTTRRRSTTTSSTTTAVPPMIENGNFLRTSTITATRVGDRTYRFSYGVMNLGPRACVPLLLVILHRSPNWLVADSGESNICLAQNQQYELSRTVELEPGRWWYGAQWADGNTWLSFQDDHRIEYQLDVP